MKLLYRVKGGASPREKSRIYLMGGGEHLEEVSSLLLTREGIALWYDGEETVPTEAQMEALSEMQLFVLPVTRGTLDPEGRVRKVEFPWAEGRQIPVLPLLLEEEAEEDFEGAFGNLQWLSPRADATAIPFEEKLSNYLDAVLVTDGVKEKIRRAFDAYVFLSYRKKDREYAARLQRLIHSVEDFRDLAIWYDEFLVPGEDWSAGIDEALAKSRLFALAVTPSLLEEGNFVKDVEYPEARRRGMPVVAAGMVQTDPAALKESFPDLPDPVDPAADALPRALLEALSGIALRENDGDPVHNFFIGLAYLSGIDVEKDPARAFALIRSAAEGGVTEAMRKLSLMYRLGDGVERDWDKSLLWQERLADTLLREYRASPSETAADRAMEEYEVLIENMVHMYRREDNFRLTGQLAAFALEAVERFPTPTLLHRCGTALMLYGSAYLLRHERERGRELLAQALEVMERSPATVPILVMRGKVEFQWSIADYYEKKRESARRHMERALAHVSAISPEEETDPSRRLRANASERLAHMDLEEGLPTWRERLLLARGLLGGLAETGRPLYMSDYAMHLELSAKLVSEAGEEEERRALLRENLSVRRAIYEKTGSLRDHALLTDAISTYGGCFEGEARLELLEEALEESLAVFGKNTKLSAQARRICFTVSDIGETLAGSDPERERAAFLKAVPAAPAADESGNDPDLEPYFYRDLIDNRLAELAEDRGEWEEAALWYGRILAALPPREESPARDLRHRARVLLRRSAALRHTERERDAFLSVSDAILVAEELREMTKEAEDRELLADAYLLGAECLGAMGQEETALLYQNRAVKHLRALWEEEPTCEHLARAAEAHRTLFEMHPEGTRPRDERGRECLLWEQKRAATREDRHAVAAGFLKLARSSPHMAEFLTRARDIWRELSEDFPEDPNYARYAAKMKEILADVT